MNMPFALPDWVPWWVPLVLLVPALLYALAFLFMPFSVLGVKTRLEAIDVRLDEIQNEIRHLALRLPAGPREVDFEDVYGPAPPTRRRDQVSDRPPIPPAVQELPRGDEPVEQAPPPPNARPGRRQDPAPVVRPQRSEPRLDWRR
jgi:hypothetical protein